jgi:hypothetical protein
MASNVELVIQQESGIPLTQQEIVQEIREIRRILEEMEKRFGEDIRRSKASIT